MSKAGRIVLFAIAIFAIAGAKNTTYATTVSAKTGKNVSIDSNTCSSPLVSTTICDQFNKQSCIDLTPTEAKQQKKETQSAVIISSPNSNSNTTISTQTSPTAVLPTMPPLQNQYASDSAVLDSDKIFNLINQFRSSIGLTPFQKDDKVCELAQTRSTEIPAEIGNGTLHSGLYNRNLPYWIWENAKYGSNEEGTVAWWLASPIHHESIVGNYQYSCVKCTGSYCSELFTSYEPKITTIPASPSPKAAN
ncbi:MAG TPA: CAP domain-containing protein [Patescibacteria group bacterium]|nr:CAP domain-containing protein [Patescibacteria group bacterium]